MHPRPSACLLQRQKRRATATTHAEWPSSWRGFGTPDPQPRPSHRCLPDPQHSSAGLYTVFTGVPPATVDCVILRPELWRPFHFTSLRIELVHATTGQRVLWGFVALCDFLAASVTARSNELRRSQCSDKVPAIALRKESPPPVLPVLPAFYTPAEPSGAERVFRHGPGHSIVRHDETGFHPFCRVCLGL